MSYMVNHDAELLKTIVDVVNNNIRPALNADGGDISVVSINGNLLSVRLHGTCSNCPCASATLQNAVQATLRKMVSPTLEVVAI